VCRSLLTQEGICLTLDPGFKFLEVAYPYVAKRLLTDEDPALRERLVQVRLPCLEFWLWWRTGIHGSIAKLPLGFAYIGR